MYISLYCYLLLQTISRYFLYLVELDSIVPSSPHMQ
nr:MAG TPA: hypothetical protein [Caudoviricetes sp.]